MDDAADKEIVFTADRAVWRRWLSEHFETSDEVWLAFPTKESGEESILYNDAVEEALCFGWIDSISLRLDSKYLLKRFTPRRKNSPYSRPNIERLIWLDSQGMIHPKVMPGVIGLITEEYEFPEDIIDRIRDDSEAWENYQSFPEPYKRIRIAYIDAARKRPEEFEKRLESFLSKTRQNKMVGGFGGVEKYYQ